MIVNAADQTLDETPSTLPNMSGTVMGWFQRLNFQRIRKLVVEYKLTETVTEVIDTLGVRQPLSAQKIAIKPEGQRAWRWELLHVLPDVDLQIDDIVVFKGLTYRVCEKLSYPEYGYLEFHIAQGFEGDVST